MSTDEQGSGAGRASPEAGGVTPYEELLRSGPPSTRPEAATRREPSNRSGALTPSAEGAPARRAPVTVVLPGELSTRPYPGVRASEPAPPPDAGSPSPVPRRRPRFGPVIGMFVLLLVGVGITALMLFGDAERRVAAWESEVRAGQESQLDLPPGQERWVWVPEGHAEELDCTATASDGGTLAVSAGLGFSHDDYESALRFSTGDGDVTLFCAFEEGAAAHDELGDAPVLWLGEPPDSLHLPYMQAVLLLFIAGVAIGALVLAVGVVVQIVHGIGSLTRRSGRPRTP